MSHKRQIIREEREWNIYTCDICGHQADGRGTCSVCHKDLCCECRVYDRSDPTDDPQCFCKRCDEIGRKYREEIDGLYESAGWRAKELRAAWEKEAMSADQPSAGKA